MITDFMVLIQHILYLYTFGGWGGGGGGSHKKGYTSINVDNCINVDSCEMHLNAQTNM